MGSAVGALLTGFPDEVVKAEPCQKFMRLTKRLRMKDATLHGSTASSPDRWFIEARFRQRRAS